MPKKRVDVQQRDALQVFQLTQGDQLTQQEAAEVLGVSKSTVARIQHSEPYYMLIRQALEMLGVSAMNIAQSMKEGLVATHTLRGKKVPDWYTRLATMREIKDSCGGTHPKQIDLKYGPAAMSDDELYGDIDESIKAIESSMPASQITGPLNAGETTKAVGAGQEPGVDTKAGKSETFDRTASEE